MDSTTYITLDLQRKNPATVAAKQNDSMSRRITAQLRDGDVAFVPPAAAAVMIRYAKPDGTAGWYDTLEDDSSAYSLSGSVLTFTLAEQMLTVAGGVLVEINFYADTAKLTTFTFLLAVEASVLTDREIESTDYFNVLTARINALLAATTHPPIIDPTSRNWLIWSESAGEYEDSGLSSRGSTGAVFTPSVDAAGNLSWTNDGGLPNPTTRNIMGPAAEITAQAIEYQAGSSGTTPPTGTWSTSVPSVAGGQYLWTRTTLTFSDGETVTSYSVGYHGVDAQGVKHAYLTGTTQGAGQFYLPVTTYDQLVAVVCRDNLYTCVIHGLSTGSPQQWILTFYNNSWAAAATRAMHFDVYYL